MARAYDVEVGGVGFIAVEPRDARAIRRGGVVIWARRAPGGWRPLSVDAMPIIGLLAGLGPPGADCLLVSPPITDGRRLRGVRRTVETALFSARLEARRGCANAVARSEPRPAAARADYEAARRRASASG